MRTFNITWNEFDIKTGKCIAVRYGRLLCVRVIGGCQWHVELQGMSIGRPFSRGQIRALLSAKGLPSELGHSVACLEM